MGCFNWLTFLIVLRVSILKAILIALVLLFLFVLALLSIVWFVQAGIILKPLFLFLCFIRRMDFSLVRLHPAHAVIY